MPKTDLEQRILDQDKMQRADHDTLIEIKTKLSEVLIEIKSLSDGTASRIADHEIRIRKIEDALITYEPAKNIGRIDIIEKNVDKFINDAKWMRLLAGFAGGSIFFVLTQGPNLLRSWGLIR